VRAGQKATFLFMSQLKNRGATSSFSQSILAMPKSIYFRDGPAKVAKSFAQL
jgi:hypothetical protein